MNTRLEALLLNLEDDALSDAERTELTQLLATDATARSRLVEAQMFCQVAAVHDFARAKQLVMNHPARWRIPLAIAAGIVIGCFSTSVFSAITAGIQSFTLPITNGGFERDVAIPKEHLAAQADQWAGMDAAIMTGGGGLPTPREGQQMMRNGPAPAGRGCFVSMMVDLSKSRPATDRPLQVEVTAHYHASEPGLNEHYSMHISTFAEGAESVSQVWEHTLNDMRDASLTFAGKALFPTKNQPGWHPITLRIDVPPHARTLVISLGSNTPGPPSGRTDHYMDDVSAKWLVLSPKQALP